MSDLDELIERLNDPRYDGPLNRVAADAITTLREDRDAARQHGVDARLREKAAEDARVSAVDRATSAEAARDAAIARAEKLEKALGEAREALETARHGLVTTHSLRATDLYRETFDAHVSNGVPVDQLEWTTDNSKGISAIDDLLSRLTTETKP